MVVNRIPSRVWTLKDYEETMYSMVTPYGMMASKGESFSAVFGRDSLQVGLDLWPWYRDIALTVILSLARFQGLEDNSVPEEAPGRIPHEIRVLDFGLGCVSQVQVELLEKLGSKWGKPAWMKPQACIYYGSVDATYMFITLCSCLGPGILEIQFRHESGRVMTLRESVVRALQWGMKQVNPHTGLVEFQRVNPNGHPFPVMRDGRTAHLHTDGTMPDYRKPIATTDLQGIAYRAFRGAEKLLGNNQELRVLCLRIRDETLSRLWMAEHSAFAMGLDRDTCGELRQIAIQTSVAAELLESGFFDDLDSENQAKYVGSIIEQMYSRDFLTPVGIRMRSLSHRNLVPYWDYQGSMTCWPVTTGRFAQGLRRTGLYLLADDMENRMLNGIQISGVPYEYYQVDVDGQVHYDPVQLTTKGRTRIVATNRPEKTQAWTVSAAIRALRSREQVSGAASACYSPPLRGKLQQGVIGSHQPARLMTRAEEIEKAFPKGYGYYVDTVAGKEAEREFVLKAQPQD